MSPLQKKTLLNVGIRLVEHNFISVEPIDFKIPKSIENAIFTSQNAVKQVMSYELGVRSCWCVGGKTKNLLEENGANIIAYAEYGKDLAKIIVEKYADRKFIFFCGNRRR
ncbi:MAG TPA: uroporphyrinogen-III synthase, partial [Flavobacteriaceae bacterium]|nr:uroporphyrinogen-III synthase [Flavobacteriaceae bacterium]